MPLNIKSFQITIGDTTYRANDVQAITEPDNDRRLIINLCRSISEDGAPDISDEKFLARVSAFKTAFSRKFPDAPKFRENTRVFAMFSEWVYWLRGIQEEHVRWAKAAKECGLIDSYLVDYCGSAAED